MATLKEKLAQQIPQLREEVRALVKEHGAKKLSEVTVAQAYGGMRGVKAMICDTSVVEPEDGLIIRGIPISKLTDKIPEEIFYLLCTGELPDKAALESLQKELKARSEVPSYVWDVLRAMPEDSHPMAMFSMGILAMERDSIFRQKYDEGIKRDQYWEYILEDSLNLLGRLPSLGAGVYRIRFKKGDLIPPDTKLDWAGDYAHMTGIPDPTGEFANLMRLYFTLHCDHEGGNVSAFTSFTVASALSDPFYAASAGLNGLAGPLHGLANQECLGFVLGIREKYKGVPGDEELKKFTWDTLNSGQVIPGYGHAVLRATDPRFIAFNEFGKRVCPDDDVFRIVDRLYALVPDILKEHGKAKNPYPNVDAGSGALLYHFGMTEFPYYTVLFGISRCLGFCSQMIINRALAIPITRPKSVSTEWVKQEVAKA
ncbi:MAG: citrate (Si)-synthase [Nitrospinota bacterium]